MKLYINKNTNPNPINITENEAIVFVEFGLIIMPLWMLYVWATC